MRPFDSIDRPSATNNIILLSNVLQMADRGFLLFINEGLIISS